jgi:UDP-3-O-[3-hydroxymyristoyl] glucosamine N-acyltransferase
MQAKVSEIAAMLNGNVEGDGDMVLNTICKIEDGTPNALSFLSNPKYLQYIYETKAGAVLVNENIVFDKPVFTTIIRVPDAYDAFTKILEIAQTRQHKTGIEQPSFVDQSATLGTDVYVGAFVYIGVNSKIGNNVKLYPHVYLGDNVAIADNTVLYSGVKVYDECKIGHNVIIHASTVIGSDGFGHAPQPDGSYKKIPQIGNVIIEDDVEIGSNCSVDRATFGSTIIRKGVKLDNLIQIAHNCEIGENTVMAALSGVSGSTKIGKQCKIGGQVGFVGHINIADGSNIGAQSGVHRDITEPNKEWFGSPVMDKREAFRISLLIARLPELFEKLKKLK